MPKKLWKAPGKTNGACWVNQHVLWIKYRSPSLFGTSLPVCLYPLSTSQIYNPAYTLVCVCVCVYVCVCLSRCSATTTSCIWSQWARPTQASMSARPSCPGSEWERPRLHSLSTVSFCLVALQIRVEQSTAIDQMWRMNSKMMWLSDLSLF